METTERKRSVILGLFVLLGIIFFVTAIFTLAGQQKKFVKSISLYAVFNDVSGLKVGNNIWFSGVKVGTVKAIEFAGTSQVKVTLNIEQATQQYIHKDSKAEIGSEGLIGSKIITIDGGTPSLPVVEDGDILGIKVAVGTDQMLSDLQKNNKNLIDITANLRVITADMANGKGTIGAFLTDSNMAQNMRLTVQGIREAASNINKTAESLSAFSNKLNHKGGLVDKLLTDTAVFADLRSSMNNIQKLGISAASFSSELENAGKKINDPNSAVGTLLSNPQSAKDIQETLRNLRTSSQKLDENLKALQHNFLLRGYFKKNPPKSDEETLKDK